MQNNQLIKSSRWVLRWQNPAGEGPFPVLLMLHGWTGDERVMWVFTHRLSNNYLMIAPRAPWPVSRGGYSWREGKEGWASVEDFKPVVHDLWDLLTDLPAGFPPADLSRLVLMGFSQGAALCATMTLLHPDKVSALAMLSGFLPVGAESLLNNQNGQALLSKKPVFVAHGSQDPLVSVQRARQAVQWLSQAGASTTYHEDQVGHKVSASGLRALEKFLSEVAANK